MRYASLCAIARDEDAFLVEWADYHLRLGFEHIYLFDNNSRTPAREILAEFTACDLVTVIDFPLSKNQQLSAYAASLREFGPSTVWMGYIDIDEFVTPKTRTDIRDVLERYAEYGGLAAHWKVFGSEGHRRRPEGGVVRNYTTVVADDAHVKSIVRPAAVASVASPHHFTYAPGLYCVNEDEVPVLGHYSYHTADTIQINHYYYKSFEDFVEKKARGLATQAKSGEAERDDRAFDDFARKALVPGVRDETALRLLDVWSEVEAASPRAVKDAFLRDAFTDFAGFSQAVAASLAGGDPAGALRAARTCLRYHDTPQAWLMLARLYIMRRDKERARQFIARLLQALDAPWREQGYVCLAEYYRKFGQPRKADAILAELGAASG